MKRVDLAKGIHHIEILARDDAAESKFVLGCETDDGTFEPLPKAWFSPQESPQLAAFLKPKATLKLEGDALVATFPEQSQRMRKLRLVFNDFAGTAMTVNNVTITDQRGQAIVPVKEDFSSGKKSQVLQIAPGDRIEVIYEDALAVGRVESRSRPA